jgi:lysozyme family protein
MPLTFAAMAAGYRNMYRSMRVTRVAECERAAARILAGRARYLAVERSTGVLWFFIGLLHMRESANNFAGVLHNGEHIIGTGRRTRLVPAGRGPFTSWEQAAIDALRLKGLHQVETWDIARIGYESERFNGFGYVRRAVNSPYVWAGSNHYTHGKYIADGVFSPGHVDRQLGTMPVLAVLAKASPEVSARIGDGPVTRTEVVTTTLGAGGAAAVAVGVQQGWSVTAWAIATLVAAIVIGLAVWLIRQRRNRQETKLHTLPAITDDALLASDRAGAALDHASKEET